MKTAEFPFKLGNETVLLRITSWSNSKTVFINVHENEQTSVNAGKEVLERKGGTLVEIKSRGERLISFEQEQLKYIFDPNRIFSPAGIRVTLKEYSTFNFLAAEQIKLFADFILEKLLENDPGWIIALHNTSGEYAVDGYQTGRQYENDCSEVYIHPSHHKADFFFTTDREAFDQIKGNFNVVLQDNEKVNDDGSLSVCCAKNNLRYINIEAMHGHQKEQIQMIEFINSILLNKFAS